MVCGAGAGNFVLIATVGANINSYTDTQLAAATAYRYQIYAYNGSGNSAYSNVVTATTRNR
jgi:hypothetical protein